MWPPVSSVTHIWTMPSAQTDSPSNLWNVTVISWPAICMRVVCSSCTICTITADLDLFYKASSSTDGMAAVWEEVGTAKPDVSICSLTRWPRSSKTPVTLLPHCTCWSASNQDVSLSEYSSRTTTDRLKLFGKDMMSRLEYASSMLAGKEKQH